MRTSLLMTVVALSIVSAQAGTTGFFHNSKEVTNAKAGAELFMAFKVANDTDTEADVCYSGNYQEAIDTTEKKTKSAIMFNVIDVYGESKNPPIDLEIFNDKKESAYAIVSHCR